MYEASQFEELRRAAEAGASGADDGGHGEADARDLVEELGRSEDGGNVSEAVSGDESQAEGSPVEEVREREFQRPRLTGRKPGRRLVRPEEVHREPFTAAQRLLVLDSWQRSGLPAGDFAPLVGLSKHTLYGWKKKFDQQGPAGLMDQPRGAPEGSRLPELTKRTILMLKQANPEWGCQRISDMLFRVLAEAGYQLEDVPTRPHPDKVRSFERARPNQLWQTDLFTFVLKRQNRRVYLVAFMDDHSRFIVSFGLHASQSSALVLEVLAGVRTPTDAATALGTSVPRYYLVEQRAMQGMLAACEPRPKGRQADGGRRVAELERTVSRLQRECLRQQTLVRAGQRAIGLSVPPPVKPAAGAHGKKSRRRKPTVRALKAAAALRADSSSPETADGVKPGTDNGE